jgi:hypothetical protein
VLLSFYDELAGGLLTLVEKLNDTFLYNDEKLGELSLSNLLDREH